LVIVQGGSLNNLLTMESPATPLRSIPSAFGRNSFAFSGQRCSCFQVMKFFRWFIVSPFLFVVHIMVLLWPLTCLAYALGIYQQIKIMVDSHFENNRVIGICVFWIIFFLFFLRMFLKMGLRKEIVPAVWVQFVERTFRFATPGQMLEVVRTSDSTTDVVLAASWIHRDGERSWLSLMSGHIRRSIDMTLLEELKTEAYGAHEDDIDTPQFFLTGQPGDTIDGMEEAWTCHSSVPSFPAMYCWCESVPMFRFSIPLEEEMNVIGHVMLLQTSERLGPDDIYTMRNPCASLVPSCIGNDKVVARRGYWTKFLFGNFPAGKPDAFIFKRSMIDRTGLKVVHTFRIVAPLPERQNDLA